jgi:hypothetical protein
MTTTRLRTYFEKEAAGYISDLERAVQSSDPVGLLHASARALSGAARLAGEDRVQRAAEALDRAMRAASDDADPPADLARRIEQSVIDLRMLMAAAGADEMLDAHADAVVARWTADATHDSAVPDETDGQTFDVFVMNEADSIADAMDHGIAVFAEDATNREWLGAILRSQRALLGSVRLNGIPILSEALTAVEDLSELIVRLDVPVKSEWLDVFRSARDVLRSAADSLRQGEEPAPTHALSRLRTLREELVDRYGDRVAVTSGSAQDVELDSGSLVAGRAHGEHEGGQADPDEDPRQRAAVLRRRIADAIGSDTEAARALADLYALLLSALR